MKNSEQYLKELISQNENLVPDAVISFINNENIRKNCTSGGFFTALAIYVCERGGIVCGAVVNNNLVIEHDFADSIDEISKFSGSKYVQSKLGNSFARIKSKLENGRLVLFSGTPCQVEGLLNFLQKTYDNLITVDIFCHGVGSPKYWEKYITFMQKKYESKIKSVKFRDKSYGYHSANQVLKFANNKISCKDHDSDYYWSAFSKYFIFRPSCYACKFKKLHHRSDFTIGDYWKMKNLESKFENANGITLVLLQSIKSKNIIRDLDSIITYQSVDLCESLYINGGDMMTKLISSSPICLKRDDFFKDMDLLEIDDLFDKYLQVGYLRRIKSKLKPLLNKFGILKILKKLK